MLQRNVKTDSASLASLKADVFFLGKVLLSTGISMKMTIIARSCFSLEQWINHIFSPGWSVKLTSIPVLRFKMIFSQLWLPQSFEH